MNIKKYLSITLFVISGVLFTFNACVSEDDYEPVGEISLEIKPCEDDDQCKKYWPNYPNCCPWPAYDGGCHDLTSDFDNCGECGHACDTQTTSYCVNGDCVCGESSTACSGTYGDCCENNGQFSCVDLDSDEDNCGECGNKCDPKPPGPYYLNAADTCDNGTCKCGTTPACPANQYCCDGVCTPIVVDEENCGDCGAICDGTTYPQHTTPACCGATCVDLDDTFEYCGECVSCVPNRATACVGGECNCGTNPQCDTTDDCCDGECVQLWHNEENCGACNYDCSDNNPTYTDAGCCDNVCTDFDSNSHRCGDCDTQCGFGQTCINGICTS